jgi:hypothetical protein
VDTDYISTSRKSNFKALIRGIKMLEIYLTGWKITFVIILLIYILQLKLFYMPIASLIASIILSSIWPLLLLWISWILITFIYIVLKAIYIGFKLKWIS